MSGTLKTNQNVAPHFKTHKNQLKSHKVYLYVILVSNNEGILKCSKTNIWTDLKLLFCIT